MLSGGHPETTVVACGVFQRKPQPHHTHGRGVQERGVLVPPHLAPDGRLLEDEHRLPHLRLLHTQVTHHGRQVFPVGEGVKHRVEVVQGMADLVDRQVLGLLQSPILGKRLFFKEAVNALRRGQEGLVGAQPCLVVGGKHARSPIGATLRVKVRHDLRRTCPQRFNGLCALEARQDHKPLTLPLLALQCRQATCLAHRSLRAT